MIPLKKKKDFLEALRFDLNEWNLELSRTMAATFAKMAKKGMGNSGLLMRQQNEDAKKSLKENAQFIFSELLNFLEKQKIKLDSETSLEALKLLQEEIRSMEEEVKKCLFSNHMFRLDNAARNEIQRDFDQEASQIVTSFPAKFRLAVEEIKLTPGSFQTASDLDSAQHIWGDRGFRLFISHKAEIKEKAYELRNCLKVFGVSGFVAHEDIDPSEEWQKEIEKALGTMDGLVALLTKDFHESEWTDQEVGYALGRKVPIVPLGLERNPYGFFGKYQSLPVSVEGSEINWKIIAVEIVKVLINKSDRMFEAYIEKLKECDSWDKGNALAKIFPGIRRLTPKQIGVLADVYNENGELQGSFGFNGTNKNYNGPGLVEFINKLGKQQFVMNKNIIEVKT